VEVTTLVGGARIDGIGKKEVEEFGQIDYWSFSSSKRSNPQGFYTVAQWTWKINRANVPIERRGPLHAGIVIQHVNQPFLISLKLSGKLRLRHKHYDFGNDEVELPRKWCLHPSQAANNTGTFNLKSWAQPKFALHHHR